MLLVETSFTVRVNAPLLFSIVSREYMSAGNVMSVVYVPVEEYVSYEYAIGSCSFFTARKRSTL